MEKYEGKIIVRDIKSTFEKISKNYDILDTPCEILARNFLNDYIDKDCLKITFKDLKSAYNSRFMNEDSDILKMPKTEKEFYERICKLYFFIEPNTNPDLKGTLKQIIKDLKTIDNDKNQYQNELALLKKKEFSEGDNYKEKLLIHYINKQQKAENEIISFLKEKLEYKTKLHKYKTFQSFDFLGDYKYHYNLSPYTYKKEYLSEIRNKLGKVMLDRYFKLEEIYRKKKGDFLNELKKEYTKLEIISKIKKSAKENHRINLREGLLIDILELFKNEKYQLFCNVVPQQIEGIIYDYCLEFGIDDKSLLNSTLVDKINQLTEKGDQNIDYEYFAFIFPVIRNRVAHGKLITNDLELNAWLLLLDLSYACDLLKSSDLNINKNLACLSSAYKNKDIFSLIKLAPIFEHGIDSFYTEQITQLNDLKELLRMLLIEGSFPYEKLEKENIEHLKANINILKKIGINDRECKRIIEKINSGRN